MASDRVTFIGAVKFGGECELDFRAYELRRCGRPLKIERIPMEVLLLLVERQGELVSREEIVERVWGKAVFLDTDNSINAAVRKIRQVLKDDPEHPKFVQTVTGRGYRFIASLDEPEFPSPDTSRVQADTQPVSDTNLIGKKISHYRIVKVAGAGGMGVVYQAEDLKLGRRVALKFLPAELEGDPAALSRLQSEARAASSLDHPNICSIYELDEHEGRHFIAMQYLEGKTLREWIEARTNNAGPLPMDEVLGLMIQIASGLEAAHQQGIIHRDIKPANIFITDCGKAKILDFGVAKILNKTEISREALSAPPGTDSSVTRTGASLGTPSYVSPEQVRGEKVDGQADIFSFGLVLYEMATGTKAFTGQTPQEIRDSILLHDARPIRQINPALCPELEKIITRALEKDRNQRYQNATQLRLDAQRLQARLDETRTDSFITPKFKYVAVAVAALVLAVGPLSYLFIRAQRQHTIVVSTATHGRRSVAVLGFKNLSGESSTEWLSPALADMFSTELAAGQNVRVIPEESVARMRGDLSLPTADSFGRETLARIRTHSNVDLVVLGSYLAQGLGGTGKVRLDLKLQDTRTGETVETLSREGSTEDLADLVSLSGASLRRTLGITPITVEDAGSVRASSPSNSEATRLYAEGVDKLQKFDAQGARVALEKAIASDPKHALSHSALARAFSELGYDTKAIAEAKKALELSDGLPRADRLLIEGRYRELTHDLPPAIEIYRTLHNFFPDDLQYALLLSAAQTNAGLGRDALQTVAQMRNLPSPDNQDAQIDLAEARAAQSLGDLKLCDRAAGAAAVRAEQQGSKLIMSAALNTQSWALSRMGKESESDAAEAKALALAKETGNSRAVAAVQHGIAISQYNKGKFAEAQKSFETALSEFRAIGDVNSTASVSHNLGVLLNDEGDLASSKRYLEDALRIQREINDDRGVASDLDDLGSVLESMGNLNEALRMKAEAAQIFHRTGDRRGEAVSLGNMGAIQIKQGNIADARASYEKSLALKQQNNDSRGQAYALLGLSFVNMAGDRLDEAHSQAARALAIRKEMNDEMRSAEAQAQLAEIALEKSRPVEAESLARAALKVLEKSKVPSSAAYANVVLARALLAQNKIKEAESVSKAGMALAQQANDFATTANAALAMATVRSRLGQTHVAAAELRSLDRDAATRGFLNAALRTRLHLGVLEVSSHATLADGVARLKQLRDEAQHKGLLLISHRASSALDTAEPLIKIQARR